VTDLDIKNKTKTKKKGDLGTLHKFFGPREGEGIRLFVEETKLLGQDNAKLIADGIRNKTFTY